MLRNQLKEIIQKAINKAYPGIVAEAILEKPSNPQFGDYATNLALSLSRELKIKPREIAQSIKDQIQDPLGLIDSSSIDGPGFLNFKLKPQKWIQSLEEISKGQDSFGFNQNYKGKKAVVEFVSANPTGPLHIGNARGGPLGDAIASLLQATGYEVIREFYVNDVGGQIDKLRDSILARLGEITGEKEIDKTVVGYEGEYVKELAQSAINNKWLNDEVGRLGVDLMMKEIRKDCDDMGIHFDRWVFEKDILKKTFAIIEALKQKNVTQEKEGALWFVPQDEFLNDRECVLVKSDGTPTYFANDISYHVDKYERGDRLINIWGSNHHGHVPRVQAGLKALGFDPQKLETLLYQYVRVKRGNEAIKMSKRAGNFVTAREVLNEVGRDAFRFLLLMRAPESHLDFDLELAKQQTTDNPVFYVQYAHARICSIFAKALEKGVSPPSSYQSFFEKELGLPEEIELAKFLLDYPLMIEQAALDLAPHRVTYYLMDLARLFQHYYDRARGDDQYRIVTDQPEKTKAKLFFVGCIRQVLKNGLNLLGISALEKM